MAGRRRAEPAWPRQTVGRATNTRRPAQTHRVGTAHNAHNAHIALALLFTGVRGLAIKILCFVIGKCLVLVPTYLTMLRIWQEWCKLHIFMSSKDNKKKDLPRAVSMPKSDRGRSINVKSHSGNRSTVIY